LRIFTANFCECGDAAGRRGRFCAFAVQKSFSPQIQSDTESFQNEFRSMHLTRGGFLRHCLACGRALANCVRRASQLSTISINSKLANDARGRTGV
jgi:hypothetical protein